MCVRLDSRSRLTSLLPTKHEPLEALFLVGATAVATGVARDIWDLHPPGFTVATHVAPTNEARGLEGYAFGRSDGSRDGRCPRCWDLHPPGFTVATAVAPTNEALNS